MLRLGSSAVLPREPSSGLRSLRRVTMDRRRYTWHLRRTAIGRAESRVASALAAGPEAVLALADTSAEASRKFRLIGGRR